MIPSKIPDENYIGAHPMLVKKINEVIDYLEGQTQIPVKYDCPHKNTYPFGRNKQMLKCRDCGKIIQWRF